MEDRLIKKHDRRLYQIRQQPYCTLVADKMITKKLAKMATKHKQDILDLIEEYPDSFADEDWSLAYPNGKQTSFLGIKNITKTEKIAKFRRAFQFEFEEAPIPCFDIPSALSVHDEQVREAVTELLQQDT
jgi:hypothetical protein